MMPPSPSRELMPKKFLCYSYKTFLVSYSFAQIEEKKKEQSVQSLEMKITQLVDITLWHAIFFNLQY